MITFTRIRDAVCIGAAVALLVGCGGSQPPIGALGAMPQRLTHGPGDSSVAPSGEGALLFATVAMNHERGLGLWSYPKGRFLKHIGGVFGGSAMCSDKSGDVWAAAGQYVERYDHNGNWLGSLQDKVGLGAVGCSVDPTTGNVAVTNADSGTILVFPNGSGSGSAYSSPLTWSYFCGYDDQGNLFADGIYDNQGALVELKKGGNSANLISLNQSIVGKGAVQWDGQYLAVEASEAAQTVTIYQISVSGSQGTLAGSTKLTLPQKTLGPASQFWIQGSTILRSTGGIRHTKLIGVWQYPQGGRAQRYISRNGLRLIGLGGLTVSASPSR